MGKTKLKNKIDELSHSATGPYAASLPLMASAVIGDKAPYTNALANMLHTLDKLDTISDDSSKWMQNNAFKAWMWGRIVSAADSMSDTETVMKAQKN